MKITYPVIAFKNGHISFHRNNKDLTICNSRGLKNGYYNNLKLIDSNSNEFIIKSAKKIKYFGILWGFNLLKGQQLEVELFFDEKIGFIDLVDFKDLLTIYLKKDQYFWDSDGNFKNRINFVSNSNSIKEILDFFTNEFYKKY